MKRFAFLFLSICLLAIGSLGCANQTTTTTALSFSVVTSNAASYNGKTITLVAYYFGGFEISALANSLALSPGSDRIMPQGDLIWVQSGLPQNVADNLTTQTNTPSGYPEHFGKLQITGKFETGGKYGHLDSYKYRIAITEARNLPWGFTNHDSLSLLHESYRMFDGCSALSPLVDSLHNSLAKFGSLRILR